ncbi:MarR family winged helix-turn-helix transcriptional regulator [Flavobacterium hibernum]|uniref:HTH-type transcriptional regulator SarZ n=1 Tax=Flavobacterium hibernum TaxID=37752 RepID=A0A0D0ETH3_9FLAO|nr:MarR family transcriptional regulator [Flavobacterium hibernum]KIO51863.1 MarR family transcriptional regulator [Flavobacterium hibernum]OXA84260.1 MarR family transcriptional regulator [Flavobacterium hibernum]PTT14846.1 MarR family transcriptional regulator [Flavobacterium sp. HMWF030]STO18957.1 Organic hydroperoxide resistance transcriptional regulator [Flavobacterium hibernum]
MKDNHSLQLGNQLCFPLYVISKEVIGLYRPFLDELDITYPQYLVMMVLWEKDGMTVNQVGEKLFLDSGTLTPLLKRLEIKGFIIRKRKKEDERVVEVFLADKGRNLQQKACEIPSKMQKKLNLTTEDLLELKETVEKILNKIQK